MRFTFRDVVPIALSIAFQTAAVGCGKQASLTLGRFTPAHIVRDSFYLASLGFLALQALTWQVTLARFPLAYAYGAMSVVYVNVLLLSVFVFHERVSVANLSGAGLIIAGIVLMTSGSRSSAIV